MQPLTKMVVSGKYWYGEKNLIVKKEQFFVTDKIVIANGIYLRKLANLLD